RARSPGVLPAPPDWLASARLPLQRIGLGTNLYRIHRRTSDAVFFGPGQGLPPTHRFDAPGREFGILYLGFDFAAALIETLLRNPQMRIVDLADLELRNSTTLRPIRTLRLVQAYGAGLSRIGCTAALSTARYSLAGAWSLALWSHEDSPDGLIY